MLGRSRKRCLGVGICCIRGDSKFGTPSSNERRCLGGPRRRVPERLWDGTGPRSRWLGHRRRPDSVEPGVLLPSGRRLVPLRRHRRHGKGLGEDRPIEYRHDGRRRHDVGGNGRPGLRRCDQHGRLLRRNRRCHLQGALFINPGGPGDSGVAFAEQAGTSFAPELLSAYDVIGFDPRGVGSSTAITCTTDDDSASTAEPSAAASAGAASGTGSFEEWSEATRQSFQDLADQCAANTKPAALLDHVDTVSAVRDLDILRALAGQEKLTYLGFSYGTYLGAVYAEHFPANTGRMVLDGAIDPAMSLADQGLGQATGFEQALRTYVDYCQASTGCPLSGGTDAGVQQVRDLIASANSSPLATSDPNRTVAGSDIVGALSEYLYSSEQAWAPLTSALDQAINHRDGSLLAAQEDQAAASKDDSGGAFQAVTCLDYPVEGDTATWAAQYEEAKRVAPIFGDSSTGMDLVCSVWGHNGTRKPTQIHAHGAAPILVVGTTGDPATPYAWAQSLADQLDSGQLLTWEGTGHTAYGGDAPCINDAIDTYLLTGTMPKKGLTCHGNE